MTTKQKAPIQLYSDDSKRIESRVQIVETVIHTGTIYTTGGAGNPIIPESLEQRIAALEEAASWIKVGMNSNTFSMQFVHSVIMGVSCNDESDDGSKLVSSRA